MRATNREIRALLNAAEATPGFEVVPAKKGSHWKIRKNGRLLTTCPGTPGDWRSHKNLRALLRREGIEC